MKKHKGDGLFFNINKLPSIDTITGLKQIGNYEASYLRFLLSFYYSLPDYEEGLRTAYKKQDYWQLRLHAHKLYGVSVTIGANQLADTCLDLLKTNIDTRYEITGLLLEQLFIKVRLVAKDLENLENFSSSYK